MSWKTPTFDEIKMDAEIGSYQEDYDPSPEPLLDELQTRKGAKTQRKMLKKAAKNQRKAMKKSDKAQRKATKARHRAQ